MPSVKPGEKRSDYVSRCVKYVVDKEGLDQKAALGKCFGMWKQAHKKSKSSLASQMSDELAYQKALKEVDKNAG